MTDRVEIIDVSPRDGLQNVDRLLPAAVKVELISRLVDAGVRRLEATSFVHPRLVPQMADAEEVMAAVPRRPEVSYIGLVLNERGLERALAAGCDEVGFAVVASDAFGERNQGMDAEESVAVWRRIARRAREGGVAPSVVVSVAFGCPFEGEVPVSRVVRLVEGLLEEPPDRLSLADTIGVATPRDVRERYRAIAPSIPPGVRLGTHFHDTRNTGIANAATALEEGIRVFDASLGGIGGCPFAPDATGNICTEDLVYMLHRMGYRTGLDLDALAEIARWMRGYLGDAVVGLYHRAGPFPPRPA